MATNSDGGARVLLAAAGLAGMSGVMAAAAASHGGESRNLAAIAAICLSHGPALLALGLIGHRAILRLAGLLLAAGTLVFAGDLGIREWLGHALFPGAAPLGGMAMIVAWLSILLAGLPGPRKSDQK